MTEQVRVPAPHLRIVSDALWTAAHERLALSRQTYLRGNGGKLWGRPAAGIESKYLLTGMAVLRLLRRSLEVRSRDHGRKRVFYYVCSTYRRRGKAICANAKEVPMGQADEAILATVERTSSGRRSSRGPWCGRWRPEEPNGDQCGAASAVPGRSRAGGEGTGELDRGHRGGRSRARPRGPSEGAGAPAGEPEGG